MDRQEYKRLKSLDINELSFREISAIDKFRKGTILKNAEIALKRNYPSLDKQLTNYLMLMLDVHFGSAETDELLMHLKAYPDWMI